MAKEFATSEAFKIKKQGSGGPPARKILAYNPRGHGVLLHCDYHDVSFRDRYRVAGFVFPDEYENKEELAKILSSRMNESEAARLRRAALSPDGRKKYENMAMYQGVFNEQFEKFMKTTSAREHPQVTAASLAADAPAPPPIERKTEKGR